jgi:hypothetical protein
MMLKVCRRFMITALPTFNTTPWGGRWGQRRLGFNPEAVNTALGYELIAPESGVLVGDGEAAVELRAWTRYWYVVPAARMSPTRACPAPPRSRPPSPARARSPAASR